MCRALLGFAIIGMLWFTCGSGSAEPKEAAPLKGQLPRSVTGHGETVESAKQDALAKALQEVNDLLTNNNLTSFKLEEKDIREYVLKGAGEAGKDIEALPGKEPFKAWILSFRNDTNWWKDIQHRDSEARRKPVAESRQHFGSQIVLGLGFLMLAVVGYVRLDEYTQRRYTTLLRLGGLAIITTLAAGWWLLLQASLPAPG